MIRFLRRFLAIFDGSRSSAHLPDKIDSKEIVSRYIFSSNHIRNRDFSVKFAAFMPHGGETSVFRISGLSSEEVWHIGTDFVGGNRHQSLKGRADLHVADIHAVKLSLQPETTMHPLHANIIDWPEAKHEQKMLALRLANVAITVSPPNRPVQV